MRCGLCPSGGAFGAGLGLGDPEIMPAAHTDLILLSLERNGVGLDLRVFTSCTPR